MTLRLWKLRLDARAVAAFAREQRLSHRESDDGYVAHAALTAAFRGTGPQPFALERMLSPEPNLDPATDTVLGYSGDDFDRAHLAPEHAHLVIDGESKTLPAVPVGTHVAFLTRVAPTVRTRRPATPGAPLLPRGKSREVDAFLARCAEVGPDVAVDRAEVYRDWLVRELTARGGAELDDFALRAFRRVRLLLKEADRSEGRKRHVVERPEAILSGTVRITDSGAFSTLLGRGLGRHRAFGFGMVLIKRAA